MKPDFPRHYFMQMNRSNSEGLLGLLGRTLFELKGDRLISIPKARPGFSYGHNGHGRDATIVTNIGNKEWKNYRVEFTLGMLPPDPSFNPFGLPADFTRASILFHLVDMKESWNEEGLSGYRLVIEQTGKWILTCSYNMFCPSEIGWVNEKHDGMRTIASGEGVKLDFEKGNRIKIDVKGENIKIWINGIKIADVTDSKNE